MIPEASWEEHEKVKILEALASGLPVVSTKVGAEGLVLNPGEHYVQADEDAMAAALVQAIRAPSLMQAQAERGRSVVLEQYDWEKCWYNYRLSAIGNLFVPVVFWSAKLQVDMWRPHLERAMLAFQDLECAELLED